jgi:periplasmic protein TonB
MKSTVFALVGTLSVHSAAFMGVSRFVDSPLGLAAASASYEVEIELLVPPPIAPEMVSHAEPEPEPVVPSPPPPSRPQRQPMARPAPSAIEAPPPEPDPARQVEPELAAPVELDAVAKAEEVEEVELKEDRADAVVADAMGPTGSALASLSRTPSGSAKGLGNTARVGSIAAPEKSKAGGPAGGAPSGLFPSVGSRKGRPVQLDMRSWRCRWPAEAEYEPIDEQVVVLRALVAENGRLERAEILSDPGHGFGAAARDCARRTRFVPAQDDRGNTIRAQSPPIRVRFVR